MGTIGRKVWAILLFGAAAAGAEPVSVGLFDLPPHLGSDARGRPQGAAVDYLTAAAARTGTTLRWEGLL